MTKTQKIIVAVVVVVILGFVFVVMLGGNEPEIQGGLVTEDFSGSTTVTSDSTALSNTEFIRILRQLQGVDLNTDLFTRQAFLSLVDFSVPLGAQPRGIVNPFLPVELSRMIVGSSIEEPPGPALTPSEPADVPSGDDDGLSPASTPASGDSPAAPADTSLDPALTPSGGSLDDDDGF